MRPLLWILLACSVFAGCATNPVTGKRQLVLMSEAQEIRLGQQNDAGIVTQYGLYQDAELATYVEQLGERMVPVSHRPNLDFHFRLLDDPIVNAFALPGGYVYITRGILAYLNDESGLAGVLGHEIGHITARHGVEQMTNQSLAGVGIMAGMILSPDLARAGGMLQAGAQMLLMKYGRDDETQSDELGVEYATKLGFDTRGMAEFFRTLDRLSGGPEGRLPEWQSTHPDPGGRFIKVNQLTGVWQTKVGLPEYDRGRESFLQRLDGLIFGTNPRNGYEEDGYFYHPDLRFVFPVPPSWKLHNLSDRVILAGPGGDTGVIFNFEDAESPSDAADKQAAEQGLTEISRTSFQLGGQPAVRAEYAQGEGIIVNSTFIAHGESVFGFHGISPSGSYSNVRRLLELPSDGFRELNDPAALNRRPAVVKVVRVGESATFRDFLADWPIPSISKMSVEQIALMNGIGPSHPLIRGQLVKVLVEQEG